MPLEEILILIAAAVAIVALFSSFKLSPVLGYLVAGAAIGPHGLTLIDDIGYTRAIAEMGVVFLLFMIGLELSLARLKAMRKEVFGIGTLQVFITSVIIGVVAFYFTKDAVIALVVGGGLALSSTALVLQVIDETGEKSSQVGRLSLAILLLQDLAVMPLLVLIPLIASEGGPDSLAYALGDATLRATIALVVIFIVGRLLIRPLFHFVSRLRNHELFAATTLFVVFGTSFLTEQAGLSMALGAFMAGLLVAETEFAHQVEADVRPYKGLLMGLFFITVGMMVDLRVIMDYWQEVLLLSVGLIIVKSLIIFLILQASGIGKCASSHTALLLAQGGEFGFILFGLAAEVNLFPQEITQLLLVIVTVTMAVTPLLAMTGQKLARALRQSSVGPDGLIQQTQDITDHVVIAGYGRMGRMVCEILEKESIPYIVIEGNSAHVTHGRKQRKPVFFGDAKRLDVLETAGISRARAVIVTFLDEACSSKIVQQVRSTYSQLPIIVRTIDMCQAKYMEEVGADIAVPEVFEGSLQIAAALLKQLKVPQVEISRVTELYRQDEYRNPEEMMHRRK